MISSLHGNSIHTAGLKWLRFSGTLAPSRHQEQVFQDTFANQPPAHWAKMDADIAETRTARFRRDVAAKLEEAKNCIKKERWNVEAPNGGFVVLDADEFLLDNRPFYEDRRCEYYKKPGLERFCDAWNAWVQQACAPAIPETRAFVRWLEEERIPYIIVTGRTQDGHGRTLDNLRDREIISRDAKHESEYFKGLFCKPNEWWEVDTAKYKANTVKKFAQQHKMEAIASVGDRDADAMLPEGRNFILPTSMFYPPRRVDGARP